MPNERLRLSIQGAVQGVGFRPFVYRLADELHLAGWVCNDGQGVVVEVEGPPETVRRFLLRLPAEAPARAVLAGLEPAFLPPAGYEGFAIRASAGGAKTAFVTPDIAVCPDCLRELRDPSDRRYRYPFTNCTACGPRYTIVESLPYDRPRTTMRAFTMCPACRAEYDDPRDRRFHAQPNACPKCGPKLELWDHRGETRARGDEALRLAATAVLEGKIVAVKGIGGFHLWCDAANETAVRALRERKQRREKPFALMAPSLDAALTIVSAGDMEQRLLSSPEAPIVLLDRLSGAPVCDAVAPGNPRLGVMLPYSPLHHLLMEAVGRPVVATSGNLSDEPIVVDERAALRELGGIADLFLVHDRPIARPVDDSVACVIEGREMLLRRARGYAPLPLTLPREAPRLLAVGGHLKGAVAAAVGRRVFVSQHLGDLSTEGAREAFRDAIQRLESLYGFEPEAVACDLHPDYASTRHAERLGAPLVPVQHHHAHVLSCLADNGLEPPALGVAWDGSGFGEDGAVWGGEFLVVTPDGYTRAGHFREFRLPGGEQAVREPRRSALGLLDAWGGPGWLEREDLPPVAAFRPSERRILERMLATRTNAPRTTSAGRLFDGVAALAGVRQVCSFEGQAAIELEAAASRAAGAPPYPLPVRAYAGTFVVDWAPLLEAVLADLAARAGAEVIAARFHAALVEAVVAGARVAGRPRVALTGGCFQNRLLLTGAIRALRAAGFEPLWHQRVPPNDGGLALGQAAAAAATLSRRRRPAPCA